MNNDRIIEDKYLDDFLDRIIVDNIVNMVDRKERSLSLKTKYILEFLAKFIRD